MTTKYRRRHHIYPGTEAEEFVMTKSKAQQKAEAEEKARAEELLNDPGKSPSDVNKDTSAAQPVEMSVESDRVVSNEEESR